LLQDGAEPEDQRRRQDEQEASRQGQDMIRLLTGPFILDQRPRFPLPLIFLQSLHFSLMPSFFFKIFMRRASSAPPQEFLDTPDV
jgi:hypothetical protein